MPRPSRPTNRSWRTAHGPQLKVWAPPPDAPELAEWWWPLHRVARAAATLRVPWPVHLDDFRFVGLVRRSGAPDLWVYVHRRTELELFTDDLGLTYRLTRLRMRPHKGRFLPCTLRDAAFHAGIHTATPPPGPASADLVVAAIEGTLVDAPARVPWGPDLGTWERRTLGPPELADLDPEEWRADQPSRTLPRLPPVTPAPRLATAKPVPAKSPRRRRPTVLAPCDDPACEYCPRWAPGVAPPEHQMNDCDHIERDLARRREWKRTGRKHPRMAAPDPAPPPPPARPVPPDRPPLRLVRIGADAVLRTRPWAPGSPGGLNR